MINDPCKQLTKTLGSKRPAVDRLIVVYCLSVNFASAMISSHLHWTTAKLAYAKQINITQTY